MSKAIAGAAMIGADVAMFAAMVAMPVGSPLLAAAWDLLAMPLFVGGVGAEAAAISDALTSNRGQGITTRQPASYRQIIRGAQRVPGIIVFCSTSGSTKRQYNMVIVLATHPCQAIVNLYLDGRQVFWDTSSSYNQTVNGFNFGGNADGNDHIGPNGQHYNFGGEVFCAAFQGLQTSDPTVVSGAWVGPSVIDATTTSYPGFCSALQANDGTWSPSVVPGPGTASGSASAGGDMGGITAISLDNPGFSYTDGSVGITFTDESGYGSGASATCNAVGGSIDPSSFVIESAGEDYSNPQVAFDPPTSSTQTPYLGGCTYVYLKIEADAGNFPSLPEIRFTLLGKNDIYDPRTSTTGYTTNWALHVADAITDPAFGLGDNSVNQDQLIAAANVCDEYVACAAGDEARYALNWHYDTSASPGDVVSQMMDNAAGRLSRIGGEWYIWPAYWQGPSFTFDENSLVEGGISWTPKRPLSELVNRVTGTYIAANFPYNVAGNLYDSNGYWNGQTQNNFPFAFQPTNYPMYACDALHGYGTGVDVYLTQDGGISLPKEVSQPCCLSISQAQRCAKIIMLRNRQQGTGTMSMSLAGWQMQPTDVMNFNMPSLSWTDKVLEVGKITFKQRAAIERDAVGYFVQAQVQETDPSVYEWSQTEELTPYDVPVITASGSQYTVQPPTSVAAVSDMDTALVQPDGTVTPRIELTWTEPADTYVTNGGSIEVQMCSHASTYWQDVLLVAGQTTVVFLNNVMSGRAYDIRVRSVRSSGAQSVWVEIDDILVGYAFVSTAPVAPSGTLRSYASGTTAAIQINSFTATVGVATASCTPSPTSLTGLSQGQLYYVYYVDLNFIGGTITPVATQNTADFLGVPGYFLIGSILTAGTDPFFRPSSYQDLGATATVDPQNAYDGNPNDWSSVNGVPSEGHCQWYFAPYVTAADKTLRIECSSVLIGTGSTGSVNVILGGTLTNLATDPTLGTVTFTIPSGTNLSSVVVDVTALGGTGSVVAADVMISNIFIQ